MKTAKRILWITAFVSLVGTAAVLPLMPDRVPMHYNAAWEIDRWGSRYENLLLPLMTIGMALFFAALASYYERKSKENAEDKESVQAASNAKVMWIVGAAVTKAESCSISIAPVSHSTRPAGTRTVRDIVTNARVGLCIRFRNHP